MIVVVVVVVVVVAVFVFDKSSEHESTAHLQGRFFKGRADLTF